MAHAEALREFNRFYTRRIDVLRKDYLGSPFGLPEARLVFEIGRVPGVAASTLGKDLGIDLGYLSRVLQGLKRRGFVQARRAPDDARRAALSLTEKGRKACTLLNTRSREKAVTMLQPLSGAERARLVGAMGAVRTLLSSQGKGAPEEAEKPPRITRGASPPGEKGCVVKLRAA